MFRDAPHDPSLSANIGDIGDISDDMACRPAMSVDKITSK